MGGLGPGEIATADFRLLVDREGRSPVLTHRLALTGGGTVLVADRTISTPVGGDDAGARLLALPGTTVTVVAFVGFVLAARPSPSPTSRTGPTRS
jgi:hypothetical protein